MTWSRDRAVDEAEIRAVVHRYADAASRRDPAGVASVFTADGEWLAEGIGQHQGPEALLTFFSAMLDGWNAFIQALLSGLIDFDPADADRASGRWFVQETGQRTKGNNNLIVTGVYHDIYRQDGGVWRICRRRYDPLLMNSDGAVTALPYPTDVPEIG